MNNKQKIGTVVELMNEHDDTDVKFADCKGCELCEEIKLIGKELFKNNPYTLYKDGEFVKHLANKKEALTEIGITRKGAYPHFSEITYKDYKLVNNSSTIENVFHLSDNFEKDYEKLIYDYCKEHGVNIEPIKIKNELHLFCANSLIEKVRHKIRSIEQREPGSTVAVKVRNKETGVVYKSMHEARRQEFGSKYRNTFSYQLRKGTFEHLEIIK